MLDDFAVFILSHGRPDNVSTLKTLRAGNYTGQWFVIIDNEDATAPAYHARYGDRVIVFDKAATAQTFDEGDNFTDRRAVIYARNACFPIAAKLGIQYFLQLDDDYLRFDFRFDELNRPDQKLVKNLDSLFSAVLDYYKSIPALSLALLQSGDYFGGDIGSNSESVMTMRKCMNTFFCSTDRPFHFVGRINEDVNTYTWFQRMGNLFLSINNASITQARTQARGGGMTELYLNSGTYIKSFYTVMYAPSCASVGLMQSEHARLHHLIKWDSAAPCIISASHRKAAPHEGVKTNGTQKKAIRRG